MENLGLRINVPCWERTLIHPATVTVLLAVICLGLHHSALSGGWRFDDGAHLYFAALYSPWQYFFVPEIMREQSWAHITPWNAFFYEIGLPFFGLNPAGHYVHLLLVLWLTSVATFFLLRLWLTSLLALMGAVLFLAMPATGAIGQMLMTGHYAYGLLFSVLTFYFFARGVRENKINFSLLSAGFYALACWSKELYVPIIGILILWPESNWKARFSHLWPTLFVAFLYTIFRLLVLHGIGGYGNPPLTGTLSVSDILAGLFSNLFGREWNGGVIVVYLCLLILLAIVRQKQRFNLLFLLGSIVVVFIPIIAMLQRGFADAISPRLLLLAGWSLAVLMAWLTSSSRLHTMTLMMVAAVFVFSQQKITVQVAKTAKVMEEQSRFLLEEKEGSVLLPLNFGGLHYLESIRKANILMGRDNPPIFLQDEEELIDLGEKAGSEVYQFNDQCQCIQLMGQERYRDHVDRFRSRLAAGTDQFLSIFLEIQDQGVRKLLRWKFSGAEGDLNLYIREYDALSLPPSGELIFGLDITGPAKEDLQVYVHLASPEGWIARSPLLTINPVITNQVSWNGKSAVEWSRQKQEK
ncbi:hypothetical protein [Nitrosomonas sp. Is37]|uniref:hypothetical protein n=1 Tax=Nitrosomonas sp. Is37 TaxID=3080535 RepID=UPI00294B6F78|nr:hypothetical protein [Nitrosomonas sp. Is37]MDV6344229.1 hypothetical protein [Nitrosomonas sp. Is37]